jgi:hypothetical protein
LTATTIVAGTKSVSKTPKIMLIISTEAVMPAPKKLAIIRDIDDIKKADVSLLGLCVLIHFF